MPVTPTYPGVYIEEVPSGVRTITGVATSITAFIGRALRGPVNDPVTINNFGDYERVFGGLVADSPVSYAVRDFYLNGGSQAVIVRLFRPFFATDADREAALAAATAQAQTAATAVAQAARTAVTADGHGRCGGRRRRDRRDCDRHPWRSSPSRGHRRRPGGPHRRDGDGHAAMPSRPPPRAPWQGL